MSGSRLVHGAEADRWGGWDWESPRGPEHFRRCSYCGCVKPEDLVAETEWHAEWADRKYGWPHKFYAAIPDKLGKLDWLGGTSGGAQESVEELHAQGYLVPAELTAEQREACERSGVDPDTYKGVKLGVRKDHFGKFYTIHLADPDVAASVKDEIYRRSGLVFSFDDNSGVHWEPYNYSDRARLGRIDEDPSA